MEVTALIARSAARSINPPLRGARRCLSGAGTELFPVQVELALRRTAESGWRLDDDDDYCRRCGASIGPHASMPDGCARCVARGLRWNRLVRLGPYRQPLSRWILDLKFAGSWCWATWMGRHLGRLVIDTPRGRRTVVCPVPIPWQRQIRRGYNQSALIADAFAARCEWPVVPLLLRTRYAPPQSALAASLRTRNVRRSFAVRGMDLSGWDVWLVDDVKTTGSTLSACAKLLKRAGVARINVAVAAVA